VSKKNFHQISDGKAESINANTLEHNLTSLAKINPNLVQRLRDIQSATQSFVGSNRLSLQKQLECRIYCSAGPYTIYNNTFHLKSEHESAYKSFISGDASFSNFIQNYFDKHVDVHPSFFMQMLISDLHDAKFTLSKLPHNRDQPHLAIVGGLDNREDFYEFLKTLNASNVLLLETSIHSLCAFLSEYSLAECQAIQANNKGSLGLAIACDNVQSVIAEVYRWVQSRNPSAIEGLIWADSLSNDEHLKQVKSYIMDSPAMVESIARCGYQLDEYNMLLNTSLNLSNHQSSHIYSPIKSLGSFDYPVVLTGSGSSLDNLLPTLKENRDKFILVTGGSSISTVLDFDITPDIHIQLERSEHQYDLHNELSQKYDLSQILLIASSSVPNRLQMIFNKTIYFFRPALVPLALYAQLPHEILNAEGPDTINSALSGILGYNFKDIYLVGVDCGANNKLKIRSKGAFGGTIPRKLDTVELGAEGRTVFTNRRLQSVRDALAGAIRINSKSISVYNLSSGLNIPGTKQAPDDLSKVIESYPSISEGHRSELLELLVSSSPSSTTQRSHTSWLISNPRQKCFDFFRELEYIIKHSDTTAKLFDDIYRHISLSKKRKTKSDEFLPRLVRGTYNKIIPIIQSVLNSLQETSQVNSEDSINVIKSTLMRFSDLLENECYVLIDLVDPSNKNELTTIIERVFK